MSYKTPPVAYITRLFKTTGRGDLIALLNNSPLKTTDVKLLLDYADGASYRDLARKYGKSEARIYQQKRKACEILAFYLSQKHSNVND